MISNFMKTTLLCTRYGYNKLPFVHNISFHSSPKIFGFEAFFDSINNPNESVQTGRAWTIPDLRRKSFEDLHKLWYVLYKERNLLLTSKQKLRRNQRPITSSEEFRYIKVKRSMAGIKFVLHERKKIDEILKSNTIKELNSPTTKQD